MYDKVTGFTHMSKEKPTSNKAVTVIENSMQPQRSSAGSINIFRFSFENILIN